MLHTLYALYGLLSRHIVSLQISLKFFLAHIKLHTLCTTQKYNNTYTLMKQTMEFWFRFLCRNIN